jgi:sialic acid synthase SpsE
MATLAEVSQTVAMVEARHPDVRLELLHCVSAYPCPVESANPRRVRLLRDAFGVRVGYSDHTGSNVSAILALSQGADLFEKHFTDDRRRPGFDHANAMEPDQLRNYIDSLRQAAKSLTGNANRSADEEKETRVRARRGVYAARDMAAGHVLRRGDLLHVRPSTAELTLPSQLIGQPLTSDVRRYEALGVSDGVGAIASRWREASAYWTDEMNSRGLRLPSKDLNDRE